MTWRIIKYFFKIPFKSWKTTTRQISKPFYAGIELIVLVHKCFYIYFFRDAKIKKYIGKFRIIVQQYQEQFTSFYIRKIRVDGSIVIKIRVKWLNEIFYQVIII